MDSTSKNGTSAILNSGLVFVDGLHFNVVHAPHAMGWTASYGTIDAGAFRAGYHQPVVHLRRSIPLVDLPAKQVGVELMGPVDIIGVDIEMYNSWHS